MNHSRTHTDRSSSDGTLGSRHSHRSVDNSSTLLDDSLVCRLPRDYMVPWSPVRPPCFMTIMVQWWSLFFYSCLFLVPSRMGGLCPVLRGPCGYFSMGGNSPKSCVPSCYFCPWEVQSHVYLDNSSSPAQTQLHTNLDLHVHQHLGWEGRRGQIIQIDQTDDLPARVLRCQGHPSQFATSAGQIECPSRCSVSIGTDSTNRSRYHCSRTPNTYCDVGSLVQDGPDVCVLSILNDPMYSS